MPLLRGFLTLLLFLILGELLRYLCNWPVSGGVAGMMLLTLWLMITGDVRDDVAQTSQHLISLLILLIMPGVVGVFFLGNQFDGQWLAIAAALVGGTLLSVLTTLLLLKALVPEKPAELSHD